MILQDHGSGGLLSKELLDKVIIPKLSAVYLGKMEDSGIAPLMGDNIALTTDSFVVDPIIFGNGDIGKLSICGTINDLAVSGAIPKYLTLSLILEEGLPVEQLTRILDSICKTCQEANVHILAGDTKVVRKGEADKIYINTAGIGFFPNERKALTLSNIKAGDDIIVTGFVGNHGVHILSFRDGLGFENKVLSDCAPLNLVIEEILVKYGTNIHYMRDMTRGGLGCIFNEIASEISLGMHLEESSIPMQYETVMAAEMLGIDPIYLANEGNICIFCDPSVSESLIATLRNYDYTKQAKVCGSVKNNGTIDVCINGQDGARVISYLQGKQLPRLC
jgi:hydrogenase expression/formation protein HypE